MNVVAFVTKECKQFFSALNPDKSRVIVVDPSDLEMFKPDWMSIWNQTFALEKEQFKHSPELYAVWASKQEFVSRAI
jgi:hypothetical protein